MRGEIISSDRLLKKEENCGIESGEEVQNTDNSTAKSPSQQPRDFTDIEDKLTLNWQRNKVRGNWGKCQIGNLQAQIASNDFG